ncbi:ABC transporter permease [Actinokineospora bangkokensis]|uniref:Oligopeptide transport system permease protein OppC n=1 Tax=Actinokineospora bangkokensis TaxID=1193682 RepID=A0A1Q9LDH2_9PSEU|nr:ABC transporter permease [Actinokineospora bangkokensis]
MNPAAPGGGGTTAVVGARASEFDATQARKQSTLIIKRFLRHRLAMVSLVVFLLIAAFGFLGPVFWTIPVDDASARGYLPPSLEHPLGTIQTGKDMLAQLIVGTRLSLAISLVVALTSTVVGVVLGSLAGYLRGATDSVISRLTDLMLIIPSIAVSAILVRALSGSWYTVALILATFAWMSTARITRGETLSLSQREFIEAARASGASTPWVIFRHLVPNMVGTITVNTTLAVATAVLSEAALSFIGLGVQSPDTSLGLIISENYSQITNRPWLFWGPFVVIVLISLAVNFIGDGLRDAFDPRQTKVRS